MANDGDPSRRRDLVLGVVVPAAVFGPFVAFGLVAILVTGLGPAEGRGSAAILVLLMIAAPLHLLALYAAIRGEPSALHSNAYLRAGVVTVLVIGCAVCAIAAAAQLPGVLWALRDPRNAYALALQIPGLAVLAGPLAVGAKYAVILARRCPTAGPGVAVEERKRS